MPARFGVLSLPTVMIFAGGEVVDGVLRPTLITDIAQSDPLVCEEAFGPVASVLVVDDHDRLCGIVAQADVALNAGKKDAGELLRDVSKPGPAREPVTV